MTEFDGSIEQVFLNIRSNENEESIDFIPVTKDEQVNEVAVLANEIWNEYFISILSPEQIHYMVDKFQSAPAITDQIKNQNYQYFKISVKDTMIGYFAIREEIEDKKLFLSKLYIQKQSRGYGYASKAFEYLVNLCRTKEFKKIWLTVNRFNENTIKVYESKGFIKVRTQVADIGSGFVMDDYIMEKVI